MMPHVSSLGLLGGLGVIAAGGGLVGCGDSQGVRVTTIEVGALSSGSPPDPDGFLAVIEPPGAESKSLAIAAGEAAIFTLVPDGVHLVRLDGVAAHCAAADNPRTVPVAAGEITEVTFEVTCNGSPVITSVEFPSTISNAPGTQQDNQGTVEFTDPDANIVLAIFRNVTDPAAPGPPESFDPGVNGVSQGSFGFVFGCAAGPCPSGPGAVSVELQDAAGNLSGPTTFTFTWVP